MNDDDSEARRERGREEFENGRSKVSKHCNHSRMITKLGRSSRRNNRDKQEKGRRSKEVYASTRKGFLGATAARGAGGMPRFPV